MHPNVWSIIEETPAGVTLHYIDAGVDTGDIIAQRDVQQTELDTGETLYHRLEQASVELFKEAWPDFRVGKSSRLPQDLTKGTTHISTAVDDIDEIVRHVRFEGWQDTHAGEREIKKVLRKTLFKYKLHQDTDLFERAFGYIREYY